MLHNRIILSLIIILSILLLFILFVFSLSFGSVLIPFEYILSFFHLTNETISEVSYTILYSVRIPRFLLAIIIGAGLATVGALLQTVSKNDLADPFLFGLSAGASAGAVAVITYLGNFLDEWTLPFAAFVGGVISSVSVIILFFMKKTKGVDRLILSGLAVSFLFTSITSYLIYTGDQRSARTILFWSMGGLGLARWDNIIIPFLGLFLIGVLVVLKWRSLDAILVDDIISTSIGVNVTKLRILVFICAGIATATFVALAGVIGFVGLIVPHLARPFVGVSHRYLIPLSALFGAILMALSDLISRVMIPTQEMPIGFVTSGIGSMFILFFILRK